MFDETIHITGTRTTARYDVAVDSQVVDNGIQAPFDETSSGSNRRELMFFIRLSDLTSFTLDRPQIGDRVTRADGTRFAVRSVNDIGGGIITLGAVSC